MDNSSTNGTVIAIKSVMKPRTNRVSDKLRAFSDSTTAHGISHIASSNNRCTRFIWTLGWALSVTAFLTAVAFIHEKYQRREKMTNIELKFDQAQYPAITICNLNPYKKSLASEVKAIRDTLGAYENAQSSRKKEKPIDLVDDDDEREHRSRRETERHLNTRRFEAIVAHCKCSHDLTLACDMLADKSSAEVDNDDLANRCICTYDHRVKRAFPCFNATVFEESECPTCNDDGYCTSPRDATADSIKFAGYPCYCHNIITDRQRSSYCIIAAPVHIRKLWSINDTSEDDYFFELPSITTSTLPPAVIQALGFTNLDDNMAIQTKAKENLVFTMASLPIEQRIRLGYAKLEMIKMCSFNGGECNIENDFRLHVDPVFGNCYTFNHDITKNLTSKRAGPVYGLRLMIFVNTSEYLPTSESAGVRLTIHGQVEYPFPDTFGHFSLYSLDNFRFVLGYSAPTGFASSFAMKKKIVHRLPAPYGDCMPNDVHSADYIYPNYDYQPEGCHRSCFQREVIQKCGCGDPRFPVPITAIHCSAFNAQARECLDQVLNNIVDSNTQSSKRADDNCECKQSCQDSIFEASFSAAKWPSSVRNFADDCGQMNDKECEEYYRDNAALVEIYYERLSTDYLKETEAYGTVNLIADFGGHLGLWLGCSIITLMELFALLFNLSSLCFKRQTKQQQESAIASTNDYQL